MLRNALTIVAAASLLATLPSAFASAQGKPAGAASKPAPAITVNINTASATDLDPAARRLGFTLLRKPLDLGRLRVALADQVLR